MSARFELMVDGESRARVGSASEVSAWIRAYRAEHVEDDPDAAHVLIRRLSRWSWLTGGALVPREQFLDEPLRPV
jgi:hypothetical protein